MNNYYEFGKPWSILLNKCVKCGLFPISLKYFKVIPILKSYEIMKMILGNLAIDKFLFFFPFFTKVFAPLVCERLNYFHLLNDILLPKNQYVFRKIINCYQIVCE